MKDTMFTNKDFVISILENSYDGIYITDQHSKTLYVNRAYEKLTGHHRSEYIGKTIEELIKLGLMNKYITADVIRTKKSVTASEELVSGKNVLITGSPVFNKDNEVIACITNVRDISKIISLEKEDRLSKELISLYKDKYFNSSALNDIICESPASISVFNYASKVAPTDSSILITGETGVGKDVVAKYIHYNSNRKENNYIKINCGMIPGNLLESELFGYVGGAFTGADPKGRPGIFEMADKGTLFLDEIGELPINLQPALLRVLQDGETTRIGSTETHKVDVRIIAATNRKLKDMLENKTFREDLYYRLAVISIEIPPLRERREDIPSMAQLFINRLNQKYHYNKKATTGFFLELSNMDWPGNIRELSNFIERQFILNDTDILSFVYPESNIQNLNSAIYSISAHIKDDPEFTMEKIISSVEASLMNSALKKSKNTNEAAKLLGISQPTFSRKYNKYKKMKLL